MSERQVGYSLLIGGIGIMTFSAIFILLVFTNKIAPLPIFPEQQATSMDESTEQLLTQLQGQLQSQGDMRSFVDSAQSNLKMPQLFPPEMLGQMLNLSSTFFLMTFVLGFGGKIANLGIMMLRPIVVKLKTKEEETKTTPGMKDQPQTPTATQATK